MQRRVNILTAVNAKAVSKDGGRYIVAGVVPAVDDIVMNGRMYPAAELAKGAASLEGKPAPAGHPKNSKGQHISAANGEALASAWIGAYCTNTRHEGGRTITDIVINAAQAAAHPDGAEIIARLDAAISGANAQPIHVSTGVMLREVVANGESRGKRYTSVATDLQYDHLAILLHEPGAGTPADGVGMFLNAAGEQAEVEEARIDTNAADLREPVGLMSKLIRRLFGRNADEMSFDAVQSAIKAALPDGDNWPVEVYPRYVVWVDRENAYWQQDYSIATDGTATLQGSPVAVKREVSYVPISAQNHSTTQPERPDIVKTQILAALNAAGISVEGLAEADVLTAYNNLISKPLQDRLTAANSKLAEMEIKANAQRDAELNELATSLAVNSSLTVDDLKMLGLDRLKALQTTAKAAPIVVGNAAKTPVDEFAGYDINNPGAK